MSRIIADALQNDLLLCYTKASKPRKTNLLVECSAPTRSKLIFVKVAVQEVSLH